MKSFLCVAPVVLAQTWDQPPLTLYNNANPRNANCAAKTSACDCHYASCSLTGDCVCGWDDASQTCQSGIPTKCVSCPAMRRCSVAEKLKIGPDGFPIPGQLSVWGQVPYPDQSGPSNSNSGIVQGQAQVQLQPLTQFQQPLNQFQFQQPQTQYQQPQPQYQQPQFQQTQYQPIQAQPQYQPIQTQYQQQIQYQQPQTQSAIPQTQSSAQFSGEPLTLYQNNVLSASGCTAKTNACDCHYASCTASGDCACGWDASSQTCRAGIPTQCVSCSSMKRCGVRETLKIGPNGFPIPGQLSVWGQVPYPDQSNAASVQTSSLQFNSQPVQSNSQSVPWSSQPVQLNNQPTQLNNQAQFNSQPISQTMQWSSQPVQLNSQPFQTSSQAGQPMLLGSQGFQLNSQFSNSAPTAAPAPKPKSGKAKGVVGR